MSSPKNFPIAVYWPNTLARTCIVFISEVKWKCLSFYSLLSNKNCWDRSATYRWPEKNRMKMKTRIKKKTIGRSFCLVIKYKDSLVQHRDYFKYYFIRLLIVLNNFPYIHYTRGILYIYWNYKTSLHKLIIRVSLKILEWCFQKMISSSKLIRKAVIILDIEKIDQTISSVSYTEEESSDELLTAFCLRKGKQIDKPSNISQRVRTSGGKVTEETTNLINEWAQVFLKLRFCQPVLATMSQLQCGNYGSGCLPNFLCL